MKCRPIALMIIATIVAPLLPLLIFPQSVKAKPYDNLGSSNEDETLYFKADMVPELSDTYLMNKEPLTGLTTTSGGTATFASFPLEEEFTYENVVAAIHVQPPSVDHAYLLVTVGWFDSEGESHGYQVKSSKVLYDVNYTSISFDINMTLLPNQRLMVRVTFESYLVLWGEPSHDSRISYSGVACYVPEFSPILIMSLFMIATLIAVIVYRRKSTG